jgi:hypothetical protein
MEQDPDLVEFVCRRSDIPAAVRDRAAFFEFFADRVYPLLEEQRSALDALYDAKIGRPADDPVVLLGVLLLQFVERVADRQAAEVVCFDTRWRLALHMQRAEGSFHPSLLPRFRQRLLDGHQERIIFDTVLEFLVTHGWVARRSKRRIDSTHVCGLLRTMSRLECVRETLRLALEELERGGSFPDMFTPLWERYVENKLEARAGVEVLKAKMELAGEDIHMLLTWAQEQGPAVYERPAMQMLARVSAENFELDEAGQRRQRRAQPTGAIHNPHEPEAQWSSKSTTRDKSWIGYKVQVAETVQEQPCQPGEPTHSFITAMATQNATESDKAGMAQALNEEAQEGLEAPSITYADGAYVCAPSLHEAQEQGRELRGPAPASPERGKGFTVDKFDVHLEQRTAVCPGGKTSTNCSRLEDKQTGQASYRIEWNKATCDACPLRDQCRGENQTHRTIVVGEHHMLLQDRRRQMQTQAFQEDMHHRNAIEGSQSELVRGYGLRRARYRGRPKVRLQNYLIGAACNLRRLYRRITWEVRQGVRAVGSVTAVPTA